jgi:hypothetical protein
MSGGAARAMSLYPLFAGLEATPIGAGIKNSVWLFPAIETIHLLALALLGGSLLLLDLRLLGLAFTAQSPATIERNARPWLIGAIGTLVVSGALLGLSEALKLYDKQAFWIKMTSLAVALAFTFGIRTPIARRGRGASGKAVAIVSLALWLTVAIAGRWIGFS